MLQAAAGSAGSAGLDIPDVFSTYLYTGNYTTQTITNGLDLAGEGGLVWIKNRIAGYHHHLFDTERGVYKYLQSSSAAAERSETDTLTAFNSDGFTLSSDTDVNRSIQTYASWSFRKAPKFFDIQTWTGDGTVRNISHNLGSVPGMIIVKRTDGTGNWYVQHRSTGPTKSLFLDTTSAATTRPEWGNTTPTDSVFTVDGTTVTATNYSNREYVAYLFAHNNSDGGFGPSGDQDIIKCGSYAGTGANQNIDLGFEAQWVLIKPTINANNWTIFDNMRGMPTEGLDNAARLRPNAAEAESLLGAAYGLSAHASGFTAKGSGADYNQNGNTYIYMAIRRGSLAPPTAATEVFAIDTQGSSSGLPAMKASFPVDMAIYNLTTSTTDRDITSRLTQGKHLETNTFDAEATQATYVFDFQNGWLNAGGAYSARVSHMWKRSAEFFDVVTWSGSSSSTANISHNLGVAPQMIWAKSRSDTDGWNVYHEATGNSGRLTLNSAAAFQAVAAAWDNTTPTATTFRVGNNLNYSSTQKYLAYLFGTVAGVSMVGSVSHSGSSTDVNCGFSNGARFVLLKRSNANAGWYVWDSVRGIIAGNDPYILLDTTAAQVTNTDYIDPLSSGFTISDAFTDGDYIFYAIA
jgi:hypothetical protein